MQNDTKNTSPVNTGNQDKNRSLDLASQGIIALIISFVLALFAGYGGLFYAYNLTTISCVVFGIGITQKPENWPLILVVGLLIAALQSWVVFVQYGPLLGAVPFFGLVVGMTIGYVRLSIARNRAHL